MILIWKNKGLLVILYIIVSLVGSAILMGILERNIGGIFASSDIWSTLGVGMFIAAIWTYLTKDDYYKDKEGNRKKMDTENELFFLSMKSWSFIFAGLGVLFIGNSIFHFF